MTAPTPSEQSPIEATWIAALSQASVADSSVPYNHQLQYQLQQVRVILHASPLAIYTLAMDGTITSWNPAAERIFGWSAAEVIGKHLPTVTRQHRAEYERLWQRIAHNQHCSGIETQRQRKDGTLVDLSLAIAPLRNEANTPIGALVIAEDISERKHTERTLQENEQRFQHLFLAAQRQAQELALLEQVRNAVAREIDSIDVIRTVVEGIATTFGYKQVSIYLVEDDALALQYQVGYGQVIQRMPLTKGIMGYVSRTGEAVLIEDVNTDPRFIGAFDGITSEVCVPIRDQGSVVGVLNVESVGDVTLGPADLRFMLALSDHINIAVGHARLYSAMRQSEQRYRSVVDNVSEIIFQTDLKGRWTFLNGAWSDVVGIGVNQSIGRSWFEHMHPADRQAAKRSFKALIKGHTNVCRRSVRYIAHDGGIRWLDVQARPMHDEAGAIVGVTGTLNDVSERKHAEEALRQQNAYLTALHDTALGLINRLDLNDLLHILVQRATQLVGAEHGYLYLLTEDEQALEVKVGVGTFADWIGYRLQPGEGVAGNVWQTARPLVINNYSQWLNQAQSLPSDWIYAVVGVPLTSGTRVVGVIGMAHLEPERTFSSAQVEQLSRFAQLASLALDNAQLYTAAQRELADRKRVEATLRDSEQRLELFFSQSLDGFFFMMLDEPVRWDDAVDKEQALDYMFEHQRLTKVNDAMLAQYGATREQFIGSTPTDLWAYNLAYGRAIWRQLYDAGRLHVETDERHMDGSRMWIEGDYICLYDDQGRVTGHFGVQRDITARKRAEQLERDRNRVLELVALDQPLDTTLNQLTLLIESQNPQFRCSILLLHGNRVQHAAAPRLPAPYTQAINGLAIGPNVGSCGTAAYRNQAVIVADIATDPLWKDYRALALEHGLHACWSMPIRSGTGHVLGTFAVYAPEPKHPNSHDLDLLEMASNVAAIAIEQRQLTDQLAYQARHDALTGLPNRTLFEDRLQQALLQAARNEQSVALLFIDLDRFKQINDTLGHHIGDRLLQQVAQRLQKAIRQHDTVARMGGDEFTLVLTDLLDPQNAVRIAHKLLDALHQPFDVDGYELFVTASIGISLYPQDAQDAVTLHKNADSAMYHAKARGKNDVQCFSAEMNTAALERMELENQLRRALERGEFELRYQPQVTLGHDSASRQHNIISVEALLHWNHPRLGVVPPSTFIPLAEESGLIISIGTWVLHEACRQTKAWHDMGYRWVRVAVNVSSVQFARADFADVVAHALEHSGLSARFLECELTESLLMQHCQTVAQQLQKLRALGITLAIDDFGTGYSSLSYLQHLPISKLKIDRSFIECIGTTPRNDINSSAIVEAITMLGQTLGMCVIAEGVETAEQLALLRDIGCDQAQGYLFGRPMSAAEFEVLLKEMHPAE